MPTLLAMLTSSMLFGFGPTRVVNLAEVAEAKLTREWARHQPRGTVDDRSAAFARALDEFAHVPEYTFDVQRNMAAARLAGTMTEWCKSLAPAKTARVNRARAHALARLITGLLTKALSTPPKEAPFQADLRARVSAQLGWVPLTTELAGLISNWNVFAAPRPGAPPDAFAMLVLAEVRQFLGPSGEGFFPRR